MTQVGRVALGLVLRHDGLQLPDDSRIVHLDRQLRQDANLPIELLEVETGGDDSADLLVRRFDA
jgi:hypothetical protein